MITSIADLVDWRAAKKATFAMYAIIIIVMAIDQKAAALLLFSLLCFWSRLITMLNDYIKDLDVIDFFSVLISINLGPFSGAAFAFLNMIIPRFFGRLEPLNYVFKDAVAISTAALLTPILYSLTHNNLLITMYCFTVIRYIAYMTQTFLFDRGDIGFDISYFFIGPWIAYFMNTIMVKVFGNSLNEVFRKGIVVSKELFLFVTFVILIYISISYIVRLSGENKAGTEPEEAEKGAESKDEFVSQPEPWQVPLTLMTATNDNFMATGTKKQFIFKSVLIVFLLIIIPFLAMEKMPSLVFIFIAVLFSYTAVNSCYYMFNSINERVKKKGLSSIIFSIGLLSFLTFVLSFIS